MLINRVLSVSRGVTVGLSNIFSKLSVTPAYFSRQSSISSVPQTTNFVSEFRSDIIDKISKQIQKQNEGRLFAIIHLCGKQFKVTTGDIVSIEGYWPPSTGDKITLNKVLVVGGLDFSLIGRPILDNNLVNIQATVIEKTLSHTKTRFRKKRRKQFMRINFFRGQHTMIRINSIDVNVNIDENVQKDGCLRIYE